METDTKVYLRKKFMQYYGSHEVAAPVEIASREFGTGTLETKIKVRHKSFSSQRDLNNYLKREVPFYISYSAAYYEFPENQPMTAKNWRGADLVFDLDTEMNMLSEKKLAVVKEEAANLLDFLVTDFGFPKSEIEVNFSGGKGYHIKVFSENVKKLGGIERRCIVDYVSGSGLSLKDFLSLEAVDGHSVVSGPSEGEAGWRGRVYAVMMGFLSSSVEELQELDGIGPKKAQWLYDNRERFMKALERGSWGDFAESSQALISRVLKKYAVKMAKDIDGSVTIDTTRLIRLPDTLHGGSGLLAKRVTNLDSFDPLKDAVAFGKEEVKIQLKEEVSFDLGGECFHLLPGMVSVPEYAAVYLLLKDKAEIVR
jgi:DNA primase small subunit